MQKYIIDFIKNKMDIDYNNNKDEHVGDGDNNMDDTEKLELNEKSTNHNNNNNNRLYDRHIRECQKRKENGNEEYRTNNYGRASFEYKIGLSYIQEYEKNIFKGDHGDNDNGNDKGDINETTDQNNNNSILNMVVQKNKIKDRLLNQEQKEQILELFQSLYLNLSQVALKRKQYAKAIEYSSHVIHLNPFHPKALYRRSVAYLNRGNIEASKKDFQILFNHYPNLEFDDDKEI